MQIRAGWGCEGVEVSSSQLSHGNLQGKLLLPQALISFLILELLFTLSINYVDIMSPKCDSEVKKKKEHKTADS